MSEKKPKRVSVAFALLDGDIEVNMRLLGPPDATETQMQRLAAQATGEAFLLISQKWPGGAPSSNV